MNSLDKEELQLVGTTVTDLDGRYGLNLEDPGEYQVEVIANGFKRIVKGFNFDGQNQINNDISLPRIEGFSTKSLLKRIGYYSKKEIESIISPLTKIILIVGLIYSIVVFIEAQNLLNLIIIGVYTLTLGLNLLALLRSNRAIKTAKVVNLEGIPLRGVILRIYDTNRQLGVFMSNKNGEFKINLKPGEYKALIYSNSIINNQKFYPIIVNKNGNLNEDLKVDIKQSELNQPSGGVLINPFSN